MDPASKLVLRREALSALDGGELVAVAGAATSFALCTTAISHTPTVTYTVTSRCTDYCEPRLTLVAGRCHG